MNPRIDKVRARMRHFGLDALFVSSLPHIRYLFGFTGSNALAVITEENCVVITDRRYDGQAREEIKNAEVLIARHSLHNELVDITTSLAGGRVGIEAAHLTLKDHHSIKKLLPTLKFLATERIVEGVASVKDSKEIESVAAAAEICTKVIAEVRDLLQPGIAELDLSAEISYRAMKLGSERDPFEPIVASGARSALPHGVSSRKTLSEGDLVVLDFGATVDGYAADFTRTARVGKPSRKELEMAQAVQKALAAAEAAFHPGIRGQDLDKVARDSLTKDGYGDYFRHSLGHGLGLNVHELPKIGETATDVLQVGNVVTLEPGVYLPDTGGVRIEDDFVLTKDGPRNLTPYARELIIVD